MAKESKINEANMAKIASVYENRTEAEELAHHEWAVKNGLSFSGKGAIQKATAAAKALRTAKIRKVKVGTSVDPEVLAKFKAKAELVGIPYQTLLNSVIKRYADGKLDIANA